MEIVRKQFDFPKKEMVHIKTIINPNDKKSNYFLNLQFELFPFSKNRIISPLPLEGLHILIFRYLLPVCQDITAEHNFNLLTLNSQEDPSQKPKLYVHCVRSGCF